MSEVQWRRFDYADKDGTAPASYALVWIREDQYEEGVTIGYFDGYTFCMWGGSDDCSVSWWAPIEYPTDPGPEEDTNPLDDEAEPTAETPSRR